MYTQEVQAKSVADGDAEGLALDGILEALVGFGRVEREFLLVVKLCLGISGGCIIFSAMSTLAEIEEAVDKLPSAQQEMLFAFLAERLGRHDSVADPVAAIIGAFSSGKPNDTGRRAEEILHGHDEEA